MLSLGLQKQRYRDFEEICGSILFRIFENVRRSLRISVALIADLGFLSKLITKGRGNSKKSLENRMVQSSNHIDINHQLDYFPTED